MEKFKHLTQNHNWIITKDHGVCNDCKEANGREIHELREVYGFTETFKMYDDDDGELYYSGVAKPNADFDPLDNFGMPNAGCTEIKYRDKNTGKYETL